MESPWTQKRRRSDKREDVVIVSGDTANVMPRRERARRSLIGSWTSLIN
jgi:hypothetical protein